MVFSVVCVFLLTSPVQVFSQLGYNLLFYTDQKAHKKNWTRSILKMKFSTMVAFLALCSLVVFHSAFAEWNCPFDRYCGNREVCSWKTDFATTNLFPEHLSNKTWSWLTILKANQSFKETNWRLILGGICLTNGVWSKKKNHQNIELKFSDNNT